MKTILTNHGKEIFVDDKDFEYLSKYRWWIGNGYPQCYFEKRVVYMHRLVMGLDSPEIDHINRNRLDNRRSNLRFCSSSQNKANTGLWSKNNSGYKGVGFVKSKKKWRARVSGEHLGHFNTPQEAALAYDKRIKEIYGEFVFQNFPNGHAK